MINKEVVLIGYSGHAFIIADILLKMGRTVTYYCEKQEKDQNPYDLDYLGNEYEPDVLQKLQQYDYALAVGDNKLREKLFAMLSAKLYRPINAIHPGATISEKVSMGKGVMIAAGSVINPTADIGDGVICNTACIIEHECRIGEFSHIAPSAVLLGKVAIGKSCLVGGSAVIKPGLTIGNHVTIGAGSVVLENIPDGATVAGNPARKI